jgi:type II secretory pathway component PulC
MINKIKDFVKNLKTKFSKKSSDDFTPSQDINAEIVNQIEVDESDQSKQNIFEKLKAQISLLKAKYDGRRLKPLKTTNSNSGDGFELTFFSPKVTLFFEKLLNQSNRTYIHQVFLVVLISSISYGLGKIASLSMSGKIDLDSSKDYKVDLNLDKSFNYSKLNLVKSSNIFKTNTGLGKKPIGAEVKCETAQNVSGLPIKLVNTVVLQDTIKSIASVQVRGDRKLEEIREGDVISNMAKVFKIERLELIVKNLENGMCESITNAKLNDGRSRNKISVMNNEQAKNYLKNKKLSGIENEGNKFNISKTLLDEKMKDIAAILTQARAIKIQNPDGSLSFKLTEIDPEGIFPYLGLQDEDIITSINGKPIYDLNEVMGLFGKIKNLDNLSLGVRREGSEAVQEYSIKK